MQNDIQTEKKSSPLYPQDENIKRFNIYEESVIYVDPMIILDLKNYSCLTLKVSLNRFLKTSPD